MRKYWVQWVTEWDDNNHIVRVLGYCVRNMDTFNGDTIFRHESKEVCEKICQMLNEEEELNNVRGA